MKALGNLALADLPVFCAAERKLAQSFCALTKGRPGTDDPRCRLPAESVRRHHEDGIERIKGIEAKAERLLASLTITVSVVFAGAGLLADTLLRLPVLLKVLVVLLLILSVLYFLVAALCALRATGVTKRYLVTIEDEAQGVEVPDIVQMIDLNNHTATRKANLESVASDALRNGLVLLVILVVTIVTGLTMVANDSPSPNDAQPPGFETDSTPHADHGGLLPCDDRRPEVTVDAEVTEPPGSIAASRKMNPDIA